MICLLRVFFFFTLLDILQPARCNCFWLIFLAWFGWSSVKFTFLEFIWNIVTVVTMVVCDYLLADVEVFFIKPKQNSCVSSAWFKEAWRRASVSSQISSRVRRRRQQRVSLPRSSCCCRLGLVTQQTTNYSLYHIIYIYMPFVWTSHIFCRKWFSAVILIFVLQKTNKVLMLIYHPIICI